MFTPSQVAGFFFQPCCDEFDEIIFEYHRCLCGTVRKKARRIGFSNLMYHVRSEHPNYESLMLAARSAETGSIINYVLNHRLATLMGAPLVGRVSHRLNRAVQVEMEDYETELHAVQKLMIRLQTLTQSAKLRMKTKLRPVIRPDTRWGSTFARVNRYFTLLEFIDTNDAKIADLVPSPACNRRLRALQKDLKKVDLVSKALQGEDVSLLDARVWLDGLISINPHYARFIGPRTEFAHSPDFEAGCVRVLVGNASRLTRAEKAALSPFTATSTTTENEDYEKEEGSFVEQLQKHRRLAAKETKYDLLHVILATSNVVECLFSVARTTFGQERHGLLPITLEMILFLREMTAPKGKEVLVKSAVGD
ncbi:hypothetical protein JG688_00013836 [Phytophthora aleatoria]|uniref:HAT C-terminal dimerisation domain-containing protein n=1 Tax=Phytophthora aleatoria TaxID=2496075 RepID=A0A8J5I8E5_9STRA|nr:hypothetical protein JG688_00013836 [Phytophthora aleatoria]